MGEPVGAASNSNRERRIQLAYGAALVLLVTSVVVSIAASPNGAGPVIAGSLQGLALLVTLRVSRARPRVVMAFTVFAGVVIVAAAVLSGLHLDPLPGLVPTLWALIVVGTIISILRHLAAFGRVDLQTVLGLLAVYVLLGLFFAYAFALTEARGIVFFNQNASDLGSFVYFSYVTLATLGYGDLTPVAGLPRALAVAEAISGQLYLVSVVALAVSRFQGSTMLSRGTDSEREKS